MAERPLGPADRERKELNDLELKILDKLFTVNAGGCVATLTFIGTIIFRGGQPIGLWIIVFFVVGLCSAIVSMWALQEYTFNNMMKYREMEKTIERDYLIYGELRSTVKDVPDWHESYLSAVNFPKWVRNDPKTLARIIASTRKLMNLISQGALYDGCRGISMLAFLLGCISGISAIFSIPSLK